MPRYVRAFQPGGTFFFTLVTYRRRPLFDGEHNIARLRAAVAAVRRERAFDLLAAVILPDHLHWIIRLPEGDTDFSWRIGRIKTRFTRSLGTSAASETCEPIESSSASRRKHRESDVWQRRFWEHTLRDEDDLHQHLDYIHYNPVRHRLVACPHRHKASSFHTWARRNFYPSDWLCVCGGNAVIAPTFARVDASADD
jgi:putative transposase